MKENVIQALKNCKIFATLDANSDVFQALVDQFTEITVKTGDALFRQGDMPTFFYILTQGKLAAVLATPMNKPRVVGHILPNEPVGELGAVSGDPRSLSLKAVEDCTLIQLPAHTFKKLCRQYPSILYESLRPVVGRSQQILQLLGTGEKKKHIALIPANHDVDMRAFETQLTETVNRFKKIVLVSENTLNSEKNPEVNYEEFVNDLENQNTIIIYILKSH
jgi:NTE family protein